MSEMDRETFFKAAMHPNAMPDEMNFHLTAGTNPNVGGARSFSEEGFETLGYQFHDFVMARTLAFSERNGRFPTGLRAEVKLSWDDERGAEELNRDSDEPWYQLTDEGATPIPIDGSYRLAPFLNKRKKP